MIERHNDIGENEIRIISPGSNIAQRKRRRRAVRSILVTAGVLLTACLAIILMLPAGNDGEKATVDETAGIPTEMSDISTSLKADPFTSVTDTVANGIKLSILTPTDAVPTLVIGREALEDSTAILIAQAADIRRDNGEIAGTFVVDGELAGKGEAKAGFCSIINGELTVGVADATPMLEQALTADGCFFRQYPLVVGGQIVENKPKGRAIRKALAETEGKVCVIVSRDRATFHDFSQALVDMGIRNAIYLVGGDSAFSYKGSDGIRHTSGRVPEGMENVNFIVWR